jgi:polyisoprenoid-binding protein YceI
MMCEVLTRQFYTGVQALKTKIKIMMTKKNRLNGMLFTVFSVFLAGTLLFITSCNKDNVVEPLDLGFTSGNDIIDMTAGGDWSMDKTHTNIGWETFYYGDNALLTGRFNNFKVNMLFDQANPANTTIDAWVQLSTFNTGEPGRDGAGKCGPGYMGVEWDVDTIPEPDVFTPIASTDTAWYTSDNVERFGDGYVAHGTLNFRGVEADTDLIFHYSGINETTNSSGDVTTRPGFSGQFDMQAISVFGVTSGSISDLVTVKCNVNGKMN